MNSRLSLRSHLRYLADGWYEKFFKKAPIFLTLFVTSKCNASCDHCFYFSHVVNSEQQKELTLDELARISESMPRFPKILISGGEPFLRKDLSRICKIFYDNNKVNQISIPTNGFLSDLIIHTTEEIASSCQRAFLQLQLSIDGVGIEHDNIRKLNGSFERLLETYRGLRKLEETTPNLEVVFCCTFSYFNQFSVRRIFEFINNLGTDKLSIILTRGHTKNKDAKNYDLNEYLEASRFIQISQMKRKNSLQEFSYLLRQQHTTDLIGKIARNERYGIHCLAGILTTVIDEIGNLYSCELIKEPIGSLRSVDYDFPTLWYSEQMRELRRRIKSKSCRCTHETNVMTNISFSIPEYMKIIVRCLSQFYSKYA